MNKIDWTYWQQLNGVKVWEACLLSLGANPSFIPTEFKPLFHTDREQSATVFQSFFPNLKGKWDYQKRLQIVSGHLELPEWFTLLSKIGTNKNLWEIHLPEFSAWAKAKNVEIPIELAEILASPAPQIPTTLQPEVVPAVVIPAVPEPPPEKKFGARERDNLLRVVVGMGIKGYGYDVNASKNLATKEIADDLSELGVQLSEDSIRKYLKEGAKLISTPKPA